MAKQTLKRLADSGVKSIDENAGIANDNFAELFARDRGKIVGAIGDSIVAGCSNMATVTGLAVASGVLTATVTHRSHQGNQIFFNGANEDPLNGPVFKIGSGLTGTTLGNVVATGISDVTATGTITAFSVTVGAFQDWLGWCTAYSNGRFERGVPLGFQGKDASDVAGKVSHIIATNPDIIVELSGINDIKTLGSSATAAQITALAESIFADRLVTWQAILAAGKVPVIATITPISDLYSGYTDKWMYCTLVHNKLIREFCRLNPEYILADFYNVLVDKSSATGNHIAGTHADNLHLLNKGARLCGLELKTALERVYGSVPTKHPRIPVNRNEFYGANNAIKQLNGNPTGAGGVGGTLSGGATGACWTGWTLTGAATAAGSNVTNADGSVRQVITVTGHAGGDVVLQSALYSGQVAIGDKLKAIIPVSISGATNLNRLRPSLTITHTGISASVETFYPSAGTIDNTAGEYTLETPEFISTGAGNAQLAITLTFAAGGAGVFVFQPPAIVKY